MAKPTQRSYSRYAKKAAELLGIMIRSARIDRKMTVVDLAHRAGVSRGLVQRIERGDMGCSLGAVLEVAAITGVPLFDADPKSLDDHLTIRREKLALLPKSIRANDGPVRDDF